MAAHREGEDMLVPKEEMRPVAIEFMDYYCIEPGWYWFYTDVEPIQTYGPYGTELEARKGVGHE